MELNRYIFNTLEDIQTRKNELQTEIHQTNEQIGILWNDLFAQKKDNTKGEMITGIISKSITAFDAFILMRKLFAQYGHIFRRKRKR